MRDYSGAHFVGPNSSWIHSGQDESCSAPLTLPYLAHAAVRDLAGEWLLGQTQAWLGCAHKKWRPGVQGPGWQGTRSVTVSIGAGGPLLLWEVWPDVLGRGSSQPSLHSRCLPCLLWLSRAKKGSVAREKVQKVLPSLTEPSLEARLVSL